LTALALFLIGYIKASKLEETQKSGARIQVLSGPDSSAVRHFARIATEYQIQDFDVFSVGLETRCPVGAKPSVEI
jgi:hypothetical protein